MASKKRKVFFSKIQFRKMLSLELEEDREIIKNEIFDGIVDRYNKAIEKGDFSMFQRKREEADDVFMVSMLHYVGNTLCGIISHGSPKIERYLQERNPETFDVKELVPEKGNVFEEYSFFSISIPKLQIAYLGAQYVSNNIPALIVELLRKSVVNHELEEKTMLDVDIKKKIRKLGDSVVVRGTMIGQEQKVFGGLPSIRTLEKAMGTAFSATVTVRAKFSAKLSDSDIDIITSTATQEEGFSSFTFEDEKDADNEVIDVIKNQVLYTKRIELSNEERKQPDVIWRKLSESFDAR